MDTTTHDSEQAASPEGGAAPDAPAPPPRAFWVRLLPAVTTLERLIHEGDKTSPPPALPVLHDPTPAPTSA